MVIFENMTTGAAFEVMFLAELMKSYCSLQKFIVYTTVNTIIPKAKF